MFKSRPKRKRSQLCKYQGKASETREPSLVETAVGVSLVNSGPSPIPWFCFLWFQLLKINCTPKALTVKIPDMNNS